MTRTLQRVVVVGLGYVGLPLAQSATRAGLKVIGLDHSKALVATLSSAISHVDDISNDDLQQMLDRGFEATTDPSCVSESDVAVICVPTPLQDNGTPDLEAVTAATTAISAQLRKGMLVILESTTYPGTTEGLVRDLLEESGLKAGVDFHLAFSPERIDPGNPTFTFQNTPKVVGGLTAECARLAADFYSRMVNEVVLTKGLKEAELSKLLENTYRHVNIALVNEMAIFCHDLGIDLWDSINAAQSKPFGFQPFFPGPGVGGHCIPIDPNYLSYEVRKLGYQFRFVELAQEISKRMPAYVAHRVQQSLNNRSLAISRAKVTVIGLTYKADIADDRETPARDVIRALRKMGAEVTAIDPYLREFHVDEVPVKLTTNINDTVTKSDIVVVLQHHKVINFESIIRMAPLVFDTRGVLHGENVELL